MYFKRLELVGFKSFCDKTTLYFEPGITAVVGPNGCGKSNIFDSIRWVLGEQSAKSLRGSEMLDVIFNGTDLKEPLGMAEVSLTFDNGNGFFNVDHPELMITRRIFRSGESEYLINKAVVRLKDILDLLMGTGIGAESYSIVAQGKIDLVLSSRPEDRRLVFDEASGITKYKAQKRETIRKLEETEQNLLRINDIITEVKRQIGSLERQANKARRYKEVFEELKAKEVHLSLLEKAELFKEKEDLIKQLGELETHEAGLADMIKDQEARISHRQEELKELEDKIMGARNKVLSLENLIIRNKEHIKFNSERIAELTGNERYLQIQLEQARKKLILDKDKLDTVRTEYDQIQKNIDARSTILLEREREINNLALLIKNSLEGIGIAKKDILELEARIANAKNEISDFSSKEQIYLARNKRLEIEKAKAYEEKAIVQESLRKVNEEVEGLKKTVADLNLNIENSKKSLAGENSALEGIKVDILALEREKLTLESHKEFLEKLKTKYQDIDESMNAIIYLDKMPKEKVSGLVVKIKDYTNLNDEDKAYFEPANLKLSGEAKPIELDTRNIDEKLSSLTERLRILVGERQAREAAIRKLDDEIVFLQQGLRNQEISLANKESSCSTIQEQFNKVKEEEDIIVIELTDLKKEISVLEHNLQESNARLAELNKEERQKEDLISREENNISLNSKLREEVLVVITQTKAELDGLNKRIISDQATLRILEDTHKQDEAGLQNLEKQINDSQNKKGILELESKGCQAELEAAEKEVQTNNDLLQEAEDNYRQASNGASEVISKIESDRKELDSLKSRLYELQMKNKDTDYRYVSIKERMLQAYKVDLEACQEVMEECDRIALEEEIARLKERLDSYGTVNLVAIEEYDELKKRYDFLLQQQGDLLSSKESLHQAIQKINRTTRQMFLETFEKVKVEFRNYFRLLFNGGDGQLFLIDEQDPLESGIEIICRPPGKKLQNVLLLSGGEKSMAAIALIFAIFKVKPSPFCILDEIDAALDEANVDRFSRILQEFVKQSQFIVITHNKKTIANANVMYGITMEQSGISKIVSVKFSKDSANNKERETEVSVTEGV